jgi:integrase
MPTLRKRNRSGKRTQWDIRYWKNGKRRSFTIGETDRRTAEKIYHEFCARLAEGKVDDTEMNSEEKTDSESGPKLSDLAEQARAYAVANKSPKTLEREQTAFQRLILELGDLRLEDVTAARMEEYKVARLRTVSPETVNIEIRILNTALSQALALGWITHPTHRFKQIRRHDPEPPQWLSMEQIDRLLRVCRPDHLRFVVFLLNTGCRRNEALGMTWEDIDLRRRQVVVRSTIGKMGKRRTIPINAALMTLLLEWPEPHSGRLFPKFGPDQITMAFRRLREAAGLPKGISIHSLRATFACHLIEKGVDIYTVSKLLGHSSVKVTERHYLALDPQHLQDAVNRIDFKEPHDSA